MLLPLTLKRVLFWSTESQDFDRRIITLAILCLGILAGKTEEKCGQIWIITKKPTVQITVEKESFISSVQSTLLQVDFVKEMVTFSVHAKWIVQTPAFSPGIQQELGWP